MKRGAAFVLAVVAVGFLSWCTFTRLQTARWRPALQSREIATQVLAEYLNKLSPQPKALVFSNPFVLRPDQSAEIYAFETAELRGLQKGFGSPDAVKVVYPDLRPELLQRPQSVFIDPKTTTPLSFLVAEDAFDQLAQRNPGFDLVVTLIGLPVNVRQSSLWQQTSKTRFALLLPDWRIIGSPDAIREAFTSGKIAAAIVNRPGSAPDDRPVAGDEYQAAFESRFILVTKDNLEQLLRKYPHMF
jgi:hypothetical protein